MAKYEEMCGLLKEGEFEDDVIEVFRKNRIDTSIFIELDNDELDSLGVVALGDKKRLKRLKEKIIDEVRVTCVYIP